MFVQIVAPVHGLLRSPLRVLLALVPLDTSVPVPSKPRALRESTLLLVPLLVPIVLPGRGVRLEPLLVQPALMEPIHSLLGMFALDVLLEDIVMQVTRHVMHVPMASTVSMVWPCVLLLIVLLDPIVSVDLRLCVLMDS